MREREFQFNCIKRKKKSIDCHRFNTTSTPYAYIQNTYYILSQQLPAKKYMRLCSENFYIEITIWITSTIDDCVYIFGLRSFFVLFFYFTLFCFIHSYVFSSWIFFPSKRSCIGIFISVLVFHVYIMHTHIHSVFKLFSTISFSSISSHLFSLFFLFF